jgi:hypothetical protein
MAVQAERADLFSRALKERLRVHHMRSEVRSLWHRLAWNHDGRSAVRRPTALDPQVKEHNESTDRTEEAETGSRAG